MENNEWYRLSTKAAVNSLRVKKMARISHNYNGDGVQSNEYSALAGGFDMVILKDFGYKQ